MIREGQARRFQTEATEDEKLNSVDVSEIPISACRLPDEGGHSGLQEESGGREHIRCKRGWAEVPPWFIGWGPAQRKSIGGSGASETALSPHHVHV